MTSRRTWWKRAVSRRRADGTRGAAAVEFALLLPILVGMFAGVTDLGVALNTARSASSSVRAAARQGAQLGAHREADHAILLSLAASFARGEGTVERITVYRAAADGVPPAGCLDASIPGLCNSYDGAVLNSVNIADFVLDDCSGEPDAAWCPTTRNLAMAAGDRLGVAVRLTRTPLLGNSLGVTTITRSAVFRLEDI